MNFTHLHVHSQYSLKDSVATIDNLIEKAKSFGQKSLAISDHGNLFGHIEFYRKAVRVGIKPIIGIEAYIVEDHTQRGETRTKKQKEIAEEEFVNYVEEKSLNNKKGKRAFHITILCKNNIGYKNLLKLVSISNLEGFYYKPRIDKKLLKQYKEGLIVLSGCLGSEINQAILNDDIERAEIVTKEFLEIFGDDFYFEIMNHNDSEEAKMLSIIPKLANKYNVKIVATNDVHYVNQEDHIVQDALIALRDNTTLDDPKLKKYKNNNYYLKSTEEMFALFSNNPEWCENAFLLSEQCNVTIENKKLALPEFIEGKENKINLIKELCRKGWNEKIKPLNVDIIKYGDRVKRELDVIINNGFVDYFLIVQDIMAFAKSKNILTSRGRGSVGGSLIAYLLGITEIDPIYYDLSFDRFLNSFRIAPPDIDLDFADDRRDEIIEYCRTKYGKDRFAKMLTFGTFAAKQCLRDAFKVYSYDLDTQSKIAKSVPGVIQGFSDITLEAALNSSEELQKYKKQYPEPFALAAKLEGLPKHPSTHASAYVITDKPITEYVSIDKDDRNDDYRLGVDMDSAEYVGILKMDLLGIETLSIVSKALEYIKERHNKVIDLISIPMDDQKTWDLISNGKTIGIFQFESDGIRSLLKKAKPKNINELADCNALYRPGAARFIDEYCAVKNKSKEPNYFHPLMEPVLKSTQSVLIYQEQVSKMCQVLGGFSSSEADYMRKAIGKKKKEDMDILKPKFALGCKKNGIVDSLVEEILNWFSEMTRYNFNKSHAVGYSLNAYVSAYIKTHYPIEFLTAYFNKNIKETSDYLIRFRDCLLNKVKVFGPNINKSEIECAIKENISNKNNGIYFGLNLVKGVSSDCINKIIVERNKDGLFKNYNDFIERCSLFIDKKTLEGLICSSSFNVFNLNKKANLGNVESLIKSLKKKNRNINQIDLFSDKIADQSNFEIKSKDEFDKKHILELEKEHVGFYCSGSPLEDYYERFDKEDCDTIIGINNKLNGDFVQIGCIIKNKKIFQDKNKNDMAFVNLEDDFASIRGVVFSKQYEKFKKDLNEDKPVIVYGKLGDNAILVDRLINL